VIVVPFTVTEGVVQVIAVLHSASKWPEA